VKDRELIGELIETVRGKTITRHVSRTSRYSREIEIGGMKARRHFSHTFYALTWDSAEGRHVRTFSTLAAARAEAFK
jgi:hypothetical protein